MKLSYRLRCTTCVTLLLLTLAITCQLTFNDLLRGKIPTQEYCFRCILVWVWLHYVPVRLLLPEHFTSLQDRLTLYRILTFYAIYEILRYTFIEHRVHKIPHKVYFIRIGVAWFFLSKLPYRLLVLPYVHNEYQGMKNEPRHSPHSQPQSKDCGVTPNKH